MVIYYYRIKSHLFGYRLYWHGEWRAYSSLCGLARITCYGKSWRNVHSEPSGVDLFLYFTNPSFSCTLLVPSPPLLNLSDITTKQDPDFFSTFLTWPNISIKLSTYSETVDSLPMILGSSPYHRWFQYGGDVTHHLQRQQEDFFNSVKASPGIIWLNLLLSTILFIVVVLLWIMLVLYSIHSHKYLLFSKGY